LHRFIWLLFLPLALAANPKGARTVAGKAKVTATQSEVEVRTSDRAVIEWDQFSIGQGEVTRFVQPSSNSAVLNRVSNGVSQINGLLEANGQVYLVNPRGIVIGKEGVIQTAGFLGSTLDLKDRDFLLGEDLLFQGKGSGSILNYGTVASSYGDIVLLAKTVVNEGSLEAPQVRVGAGEEILLKQKGMERIFVSPKKREEKEGTGIENFGSIETSLAELKADGNIYRLAINHEGVIDANGIREESGRVFLVAEGGNIRSSGMIAAKGGIVHLFGNEVEIDTGAVIDVSGDHGGGEVLLGGHFQGKDPTVANSQFTHMKEGAKVCADALIDGDGGKVILWSDHTTWMKGEIFAQGGPEGGDGGFVEVSGLYGLQCKGPVSTFALEGKTGTLLLDPSDITIVAAGGNPVHPPCFGGVPPGVIVDILFADLTTCLASSNVTIQTSLGVGFPAPGNITLFTPGFTWTTPNDLTLIADNDIIIRDNLAYTGVGSAGSPTLTLTAAGNVDLVGVSAVPATFGFPSGGGTFNITAGGDITCYSTGGAGIMLIEADVMNLSGANITIGGAATVTPVNLFAYDSLDIVATGNFLLRGSDSTLGAFMALEIGGVTSAAMQVGGDFQMIGGAADSAASVFEGSAGGLPAISIDIGGEFRIEGGSGTQSLAIMDDMTPTITVGGDVVFLGGSGTDSSATIENGAVTFNSVGGDFLVTGGGGTAAVAGLLTDDLFINNVMGNIDIEGSTTGINSFAQVGINNSVTIDSVDGFIFLKGGVDGGAYAQIGPCDQISISNVTNSISLSQPPGSAGYAQIGEATNLNFQSIDGGFILIGSGTAGGYSQIGGGLTSISDSGGFLLQGGSDTDTYAQIGPGPVAITGVSGDVSLTGGTAANVYAQIGGDDVAINGVTGTITLEGGTVAGAYAQIGVGGNINISNVDGDIDMQQPATAIGYVQIGGGDAINFDTIGGSILLEGGQISEAYSQIGDGPITINGVGGDISLIGGGAFDTFAVIGNRVGTDDVTIQSLTGDLLLRGGVMNSVAQVGPGGDILISGVGGDISIEQPNTAVAIAKIGDGDTITINSVDGSILLEGGRQNQAAAQIGSGQISINGVGGDVSVIGGDAIGNVDETFALIGSGGPISITNVTGDILVLGGPGAADNYAHIGSVSGSGGDITINGVGGNVVVQGGSATAGVGNVDAHAQIGHNGRDSTGKTGDVRVTNVGSITVTGGTNRVQNYAQIGHANGVLGANFTASGDVILNGRGSLTVQSVNTTAMVGHGNLITNTTDTYSGSVTAAMQGNAQIIASSTGVPAGVGFLNEPSEIHTVTSPLVALSSRNLTITGDGGGDAFLGYSNPTTIQPNVAITLVSAATSNNVVLNGVTGNATIGAFADTLFARANSVNVNAGGDIVLNTAPTFEARIVTNNPGFGLGPFDTSLLAENIFVGNSGGGLAQVFGSRSLEAIANVDMFLRSDAEVTTRLGDITLVVDNAFPDPPEAGPGRFVINSGATLDPGTRLRIFTSAREQNSINAPLNGVVFVPGPELINSPIEQWATYFFDAFGGTPFTIFYKTGVTADFVNEIHHATVAGMFQNLRPYDDLFFSPKCFLLRYDRACYDLLSRPSGMISSFDLLCEETWESLEQEYRNYQTIR